MSFTYSRALVVGYLQANSSDADASAPSKSSHTHAPSLSPGKTMEACPLSRYGMTCGHSEESHGEELLTWWLAASRAKTSPPLERERESTASKAPFGGRWLASFAKYDPAELKWRTPQLSLAGDLAEFSGTWPKWGSMRDGECWELDMSGLPTSATGSGSLPTPSGTSNHGKNHVCGRLDEWGGSSNPWRGTEIGRTSSPAFEEWVMGWPVQWTELTAYETGKFQQWLQQHGKS